MPIKKPVRIDDGKFLVAADSELVTELPDATQAEKLEIVRALNQTRRGKKFQLSDRERHTIIAALRCWQIDLDMQEESRHNAELLELASNNGAVDLMTAEEIDTLCEGLNCA